jgi:hypothetical protein
MLQSISSNYTMRSVATEIGLNTVEQLALYGKFKPVKVYLFSPTQGAPDKLSRWPKLQPFETFVNEALNAHIGERVAEDTFNGSHNLAMLLSNELVKVIDQIITAESVATKGDVELCKTPLARLIAVAKNVVDKKRRQSPAFEYARFLVQREADQKPAISTKSVANVITLLECGLPLATLGISGHSNEVRDYVRWKLLNKTGILQVVGQDVLSLLTQDDINQADERIKKIVDSRAAKP